jgi:hypothetical protein
MTETDALSLDRFRALADAYGGVVARWPASVREQAAQRAKQPAFAQIVESALALDEMLDSWTVAPAPQALAQAIIARAPTRPRIRAGRWFWWPGIGLATALAGAGVGVVAAAIVAPTQIVSSDFVTAFGDVGSQES